MCIECANFVTQASVTSLYRTVMYVAVYNQRCIKLKAYANIYTYITCFTQLQYFIHICSMQTCSIQTICMIVFLYMYLKLELYIYICVFLYITIFLNFFNFIFYMSCTQVDLPAPKKSVLTVPFSFR